MATAYKSQLNPLTGQSGYSPQDLTNYANSFWAEQRGVAAPGVAPGTAASTGLPQIEQLTAMVNEINQRAQQAANKGRIPGGGDLENQSSANIASALAGEIDPSTLNLLGQQAAERGVMTGSPMGPGSNAEYLRALGLTSLDRMNTGQNWLSAATARNPAAPIYDAGHQVLTAAQIQQAELAREEMANRLRVAQIQASGRGGGGRGSGAGRGVPNLSPNWIPLFTGGGGGGGGSSTVSSLDYAPQTSAMTDAYLNQVLTGYPATPIATGGPNSLLDSGWDDYDFYGDNASPAPTSLEDFNFDDFFYPGG